MKTAASAARSRSASAKTMTGFLPPSSKCTRFSVSAPCFMISEPVRLSPTKPIALMSGCSVSALPASSPKPLTRFQTPCRQAGLLGDLDEQASRQRRQFRRLVDDSAAGGERRRDLPGGKHEGRIPRRDDADRADRHAGRDVDLAFVAQRLAVARLRRAVGEEAEILGPAQRRLGHEFQRLPGVHAFDEGDFLGAGDDRVGDFVQQLLACFAGHRRPVAEGGLGGLGSPVDVGGLAASHRASGFRSIGEIVSKVAPSAAGTASPPIWFSTPSRLKRSR